MKKLIIGISGADGVCIGSRMLEILKPIPDVETHLILSKGAETNFRLECGIKPEDVRKLADFSYDPDDMTARIASGSFVTEGMIAAPCSMKTLSAIAHGYADNLLVRAAEVCLKENRRVVLMPRETPLSLIDLRNLVQAAEAGCAVVPPMLTFYHHPESIQNQVDQVIGKALLQFGIRPDGFRSWNGPGEAALKGE